jgi:hypothetical protein
MKNSILGLVVIAALFGCEPKEKVTALQSEVDSLTLELGQHMALERDMNEVGILIDSIDESRKLLQLKMAEGNNAPDYLTRLRNINLYVQKTEGKLKNLEASSQNSSKESASAIRRLKADLGMRSQEILELQLQIAELSDANIAGWLKVGEQDSLLYVQNQTITLNEADIASLEKQRTEAEAKNRIAVANLYFDQAAAVEKVADRTQFAPRKKKQARLWALDLYKVSQSLGNTEAHVKIALLEKKLS